MHKVASAAIRRSCLPQGTGVYLVMAFVNDAGVSLSTIMIGFLLGPMLLFIVLSLLLWRPRMFPTIELPPSKSTTAALVVPLSPTDGGSESEFQPLLSVHNSTDKSAVAGSVQGIDKKRLQELPFMSQIRTPEFGLFVVYLDLAMLRVVFFLASADPQLNLLGQEDSEYTRLLGAILPLGFLAQFVVGSSTPRVYIATFFV